MEGTVLTRPVAADLPAHVAALERGWSPDTLRAEVAREQLRWIGRDAAGFLASLDDPDGRGPR